MRFALFGDHPDGLDLACALVATGRHELGIYTGASTGADLLQRRGLTFRRIGDVEEVLADPAVGAVIIAGSLADRPAQLRRALQSERPVLCVHPADQTPDIAYESAMIQTDTRCLLLPLLPQALHPGVARLAELARAGNSLGKIQLIEAECWSPESVWVEAGAARVNLPGWDVLRTLGGEIAEVSAFAPGEEAAPEEPLLLAGRFEGGRLFRATFLSGQHENRWRWSVLGSYGRADLVFPDGWPGPAKLTWRDENGLSREEGWETWNPWPALVQRFEAETSSEANGVPAGGRRPTWQDEIRSLELDDAARRSVHYRRVTALEYPEPSEEVGFKGTMTLVGCGLLWLMLLLLILSAWVPKLGWLIVPLLVGFLLLQFLRWFVPRPGEDGPRGSANRG
jgi:predicted dehydrogenase